MRSPIERQPQISIEVPKEGDETAIGEVHYQSWLETYKDDESGITEDVIKELIGFVNTPEGNEYRKHVFAEARENPDKVLYRVIRKGNKIVGFMHCTKEDAYNELGGLYLLNEIKGTGVGDRLMKEFLEWADKHKPSLLEVFSTNERAQSFYEKYGFERTGKPEHFFKKRLPFIEMVRPAERVAAGTSDY